MSGDGRDTQLRRLSPFAGAGVLAARPDREVLQRAREWGALWMDGNGISPAAATETAAWFYPPPAGTLRAESERLVDIKLSAGGEFLYHLMQYDDGAHFLADMQDLIAGDSLVTQNPRILAAMDAAKNKPSLMAADMGMERAFPQSKSVILDPPKMRRSQDGVAQDAAAREHSPVELFAQRAKAAEMGMHLMAYYITPEMSGGRTRG